MRMSKSHLLLPFLLSAPLPLLMLLLMTLRLAIERASKRTGRQASGHLLLDVCQLTCKGPGTWNGEREFESRMRRRDNEYLWLARRQVAVQTT